MAASLSYNSISKKWNIFFNLFFSLYSLICIGPLFLILAVSFTDEKAIWKNGYSFIPEKFSLRAYKYVLSDASVVMRAYGVTIFVTVIGTLLALTVTSLYAYPLSRKDFRYRYGFTLFMYFTMLFSGGLVPWYLVCVYVLHIKNTIWAMILPACFSGWNAFLLRTFFATSLPESVIESARIDGAGELRTFVSVVLPLSLPGLATVGLFNTIAYWNDWWLPLILITDEKLFNLQYSMYRVQQNIQYLIRVSSSFSESGRVMEQLPTETARMAMCVLAIGPIVMAYPFFQKYFVKGLTVGAIKG